jgi:tetratricopeptide (TPR) repeat protein
VTASFQPILAARDAGRAEVALLALRVRAEKGPYPGYAWYFLGQVAQREGAFAAAVVNYRKAVAADPTVADRQSAFGAADALRRDLSDLKRSAWARSGPPELADLRYLERRLAGGCE